MTLRFENEIGADFGFDCEALAKEVLSAGLTAEDFPYEAELSLTITDEESIRDLNRTYRKVDKPTDVLSFPLLEYPAPADFSHIGENDDNFNPDTGEVMLGDIVLSAVRVKTQAEAYGHSVKREYAFLLVHSLLHLLGYDHETEKEEAVMKRRQDEILEEMQITRA